MKARLVTPHADDDLDVDSYGVTASGALRVRVGDEISYYAPGEWETFSVVDPEAD